MASPGAPARANANASDAHATAPTNVRSTLITGPLTRNPVGPLPSASTAAGVPAPAAAVPGPLGASSTRRGGVVVGSTAHSAAGGPRRDGGTPRRLATLGGTSRRGETSYRTLLRGA